MTMLALRDLTVRLGGRTIIEGLTLPDLRAGELTVLAGPNAAGKSTLLRAMAHLVPHDGQATLDGRDLGRMGAGQRAQVLGFMPQSQQGGSSLSVLESVVTALRAGGEPAHGAEVAAMAMLERLDIAGLALTRLDRLSGGQRQMVGLAQAIVRNPRLLLLDEPTSALDMAFQTRLMAEVRRLAADGRIVIAVLHDLSLAAQWADRIVVLHGGRIHGDGAPEHVLTPRMLADVYSVDARVERCSRGRLVVLVDGEIARR